MNNEEIIKWKFILGSINIGLDNLLYLLGLKINDHDVIKKILENEFNSKKANEFDINEDVSAIIERIIIQNKNEDNFKSISSWINDSTVLSPNNRSLLLLSQPLKAFGELIPLDDSPLDEFFLSKNGKTVISNIKKYLLPYPKIIKIISSEINDAVNSENNMLTAVNLKLIFLDFSMGAVIDVFFEAIEAKNVLKFWENTQAYLNQQEKNEFLECVITQAKKMNIPTNLIILPEISKNNY